MQITMVFKGIITAIFCLLNIFFVEGTIQAPQLLIVPNVPQISARNGMWPQNRWINTEAELTFNPVFGYHIGRSFSNDPNSLSNEELENVWPDYSCEQLRRQDCPSWARDLCKQSYQNCGSHNDGGNYNIFTTGYSNKIVWYSVDEAKSEVKFQGESEIEPNLSFGAVDSVNKNIYFVHEVKSYGNFTNNGAVSRWTISKEIAKNSNIPKLTKQEVLPSEGTAPAHISLDTTNNLIHVTNYDYKSGSFAVYALDGSNQAIRDNIYVDKFSTAIANGAEGERASHAHQAVSHGKFVYVVDLGLNKIMHYQVLEGNTIRKANPSYYSLPKGFGPRHMVVTTMLKDDQKAYVLNEKQPYITIFNVNSTSGALKQQYSVQTLPIEHYTGSGEYGAEIALHPSEKWLYISHRGTGSIIAYQVLENGFLVQSQIQPTSGTWPRHFTISKSGKLMFVSLQHKNLIDVFKIDQSTGKLERLGVFESANAPAYVGIF